MHINIIAVGKLKEDYWREASAEYIKRLKGFCTVEVTELPESRLPQKFSTKDIELALEREAELFLPYLRVNSVLNMALCIEGKSISSEALAQKILNCSIEGRSKINVCIGSSHGLSESVKKECLRISMSAMTFPHQLARIMVLEQLYRAFHINVGGKYHK